MLLAVFFFFNSGYSELCFRPVVHSPISPPSLPFVIYKFLLPLLCSSRSLHESAAWRDGGGDVAEVEQRGGRRGGGVGGGRRGEALIKDSSLLCN